jgi:hypothetical protein
MNNTSIQAIIKGERILWAFGNYALLRDWLTDNGDKLAESGAKYNASSRRVTFPNKASISLAIVTNCGDLEQFAGSQFGHIEHEGVSPHLHARLEVFHRTRPTTH